MCSDTVNWESTTLDLFVGQNFLRGEILVGSITQGNCLPGKMVTLRKSRHYRYIAVPHWRVTVCKALCFSCVTWLITAEQFIIINNIDFD